MVAKRVDNGALAVMAASLRVFSASSPIDRVQGRSKGP